MSKKTKAERGHSHVGIWWAIGILIAFSVTSIVLLIIRIIEINGWKDGWGSFFGAVIGGGATLVAVSLTIKASQKRFEVLLHKDRPRFDIKIEKYYEKLPPLGQKIKLNNEITLCKEGNVKDSKFSITITNKGNSQVEKVSFKLKGTHDINNKKIENKTRVHNFKDSMTGNENSMALIRISHDEDVISFVTIELYGEYVGKPLTPYKKTMVYFPKHGWETDFG